MNANSFNFYWIGACLSSATFFAIPIAQPLHQPHFNPNTSDVRKMFGLQFSLSFFRSWSKISWFLDLFEQNHPLSLWNKVKLFGSSGKTDPIDSKIYLFFKQKLVLVTRDKTYCIFNDGSRGPILINSIAQSEYRILGISRF